MGREAYTGFWWGNLSERGHLVNPGADGRLILRWIFKKGGWRGMDLIELAHDKDRWQEIVNVVCSQFLEPDSFPRTLLHGVSKFKLHS
jgi:hypothetical protein